MKRVGALAAAAVAVVAATASLASTGGEDDVYRVQAIFDDAPVNTGADVLVAGVRVGQVAGLDVTAENKAAVTLRIDDPRFVPFRRDARCGSRLQSLIGERSITCEPGTPSAPPLVTADGEDGDPVLPIERTSGSVDLDLITAISRRPSNEQLAILLTELGATTAARGPELAAIIRRANPALGETERVLAILARQARDLEGLAVDGDRAMRELAPRRRELVGLVRTSTRAAAAAVDRRAALDTTLRRLPGALDELEPLMAQAADFARRTTPVLRSLGASGADLAEATETLAPFARRTTPALQQLARTARRQRTDLPRLVPLARRLTAAGEALTGPATDLGDLLESVEKQNGITNLLGIVYGAANAGNGFDASGHFVRGQVLSGVCGQYTNSPYFGCDAQFGQAELEGDGDDSETRAAASGLLDYLLGEDER
jgi:phospholipid/cholesterol/gamma-HCH transport system substrate-binding protein